MRRNAVVFLAFFCLSLIQIHWLNLLTPTATVSLPLTLLLLLAPYVTRGQMGVAVLGSALPLDYTSVLPFGSYLLSLLALAGMTGLVIKRFPIREHRLFHLALVAGGSLLFFFTLFVLTSLAVAARLAPWSITVDRGLLSVVGQQLAWNTTVATLAMLFARPIRRALGRRFILPYASN